MTSRDRVKELLSTTEGQEKFIEWLGDEVTQLMLDAAREMARPLPPRAGQIEATQSLFEYGGSVRSHEILDYLANPVAQTSLSGDGKPRGLDPDYGASAILKENK